MSLDDEASGDGSVKLGIDHSLVNGQLNEVFDLVPGVAPPPRRMGTGPQSGSAELASLLHRPDRDHLSVEGLGQRTPVENFDPVTPPHDGGRP